MSVLPSSGKGGVPGRKRALELEREPRHTPQFPGAWHGAWPQRAQANYCVESDKEPPDPG